MKNFFAQNYAENFLPTAKNIGEFLEFILRVDEKCKIPSFLRSFYLYEAIAQSNTKALGEFAKNFTQFLQNSSFFLKFYDELCAECVQIESLEKLDIYAFYDDHLQVLKKIFSHYQENLKKNSFFDHYFLENYQITFELLREFERIIFQVDGFLSTFEMQIFKEISTKIPIIFNLNIDNFNKDYYTKIFHTTLNLGFYSLELKDKTLQILTHKETQAVKTQIQILEFRDKIAEVGGIFAQIDLWLERGIKPEEIYLVLPDEEFVEYLKLFDKARNFNFAMGQSLCATNLYLAIQKIEESDCKFQNLNALEDFLKNSKESQAESPKIREKFLHALETFKFSLRYLETLNTQEKILIFLNILKDSSLDDVGGGRISVIGILETRGMNLPYIIIPEFNAENVPSFNDKDIFLNTKIRENVGLPTRKDRENLQKYYYAQLIKNSKETRILCLNNDESQPSRLLLEESLFKDVQPLKAHLKYSAYFLSGKPLTYKEKTIIAPLTIRTFSPTSLECFLTCKRKFYYRYIAGFKESSPSATLGNKIHEAFREVYTKAQETRDFDTTSLYHNLCEKLENNPNPKEKFESKLAQKYLQKFFLTEKKHFEDGWIPIEFEKNFSFSCNGILLRGRVDRIDKRDKEIFILDYKYKRNLKIESQKSYENAVDFQLPIYHLAAQELYPDCSIQAGFYDIYEAQIKKEQDISCKIKILKEKIQEIQESLQEVDFSLTQKRGACQYCDFIYLCNRY